MISSRYPIELNKWHECSIEISNQVLSLIVDHELPVIFHESFSMNTLWPRSFTFIGCLPNQYRSTGSLPLEGFHGAIQKVNERFILLLF